jgi:nucleotide-binding universal stress UspA family protein
MRVLVATDLSDAADAALREGAALASSSVDSLGVVHVLDPVRLADSYVPSAVETRLAILARASAALSARTARYFRRPAELFVEGGTDSVGILRRAEEWRADVVVVGSSGRSAGAHALGRVAEAVVRSASCDVLVARDGDGRGWVLATTDLTERSFPAIRAAANEARRRGAKLEVVHAIGFLDAEVSYLVALGTPSIAPPPNVFEVTARRLSQCVAGLQVDASCRVIDRPAGPMIVREAAALRAELVVVGSHGRSAFARLGPSGVLEKVLHTAPCSVLVVRLGASQ